MRKEIDILVKAARKNCAVVEKDSCLLWTPEELAAAQDAGCVQAPTHFLPPDQQAAPLGGRNYRLVGQTRHFIIFAPAPGGP